MMPNFLNRMIDSSINPKVLLYLFLVSTTLVVYWQVNHHDFINLDDPIYVTDNRQVKNGITQKSIVWAFSFKNKDKTYWHPLTWISHMLDVHVYGMAAGRHHLTNVLFHIANTLLLFGVLHRMTGHIWRSGLVAALFALHPINVESVAWVAERKNVLSTFFWMLTMLLYCYYVQRRRLNRYVAVLGVFILGLLAKPMLVTLPFVLLLLDYWPLGRFALGRPLRHQLASALGLIVEKVPLLIVSALSVYMSTASVQGPGEVISFHSVPLSLRVANALVSYIKYVIKMIWPQDLAIFYPYPEMIPLWQVIGAAAILVGISVLVLRSFKRQPYFVVGWLWYLGTLVPVMGLIQVGLWPAMADRWAYVPLIGLFIMLTWGVAEYVSHGRQTMIALKLAMGALLVVLIIIACFQIGHWTNSIALYEHSIKSTGGTWVEHNCLANALKDQGRVDRAIHHYNLSLQNKAPEPERIYNNIGIALASQGRFDTAITYYDNALRIDPDFVAAHINMGVTLNKQGRTAKANHHFEEAIRLDPGFQAAYFNFGIALLDRGQIEAAMGQFHKSLRLKPDFAESHNMLGLAFMRKGKLEAAVGHFQRAVQLKPHDGNVRRNLNKAMSVSQKLNQAVKNMYAAMDFGIENSNLELRLKNLLEKKKELDQVVGQLNRSLSLQPGFNKIANDDIVIVAGTKKRYEKALFLFKEASRLRPDSAVADYHIACIYARQGRMPESVKWLDQAIQKGFDRWDLIRTDSDLENIRGYDGYQLLVKG